MANAVENQTQDIRSMTNQELVHKICDVTKEERRITIEVLRLLREIERRQLFAELGHSSLFAYCTNVLRYSEAAACRRIEAMRAMRETPEIEVKLESGELGLSAVTQARTTIRHHEKFAKAKVTPEKRKDAMLSLCGQSKREADKALALEFSTPLPTTPVVQRETARGTTRVTIEFTEDEMEVFNEIKRLSGHPQNLKDTILRLAAEELTQLKKSRGEMPVRTRHSVSSKENLPSPAEEKNEANRRTSAMTKSPRSIPISIKRSAWDKAGGRCEFRNADGERCDTKHALEYDHISPVAMGGHSNKENLRLLCRQHNLLAATQTLGPKLMSSFVPAIR